MKVSMSERRGSPDAVPELTSYERGPLPKCKNDTRMHLYGGKPVGNFKSAFRGFSLIELMTAITVAAIMLVIAVPSFRYITISSRLTAASNDVVSAIYAARMEAIKLNGSTQLCSNLASLNTAAADTLGTKCTTETGAVWALIGGTPQELRVSTAGIASPLQMTGNMAALRFTSAGLAQKPGSTTLFSGLVVDICSSSISTNNHRTVSMSAGSIIATQTTTASCP